MIVVSYNHPSLRFSRRETFRAVRCVLRGEKRVFQRLSVVFTNNGHMRRLNKEYLKHEYSTDVIAFDYSDEGGADGELYVNLDRARRQAREYKVTFSEEARRLLIHGVLHILGYDDSSKAQREMMRLREDAYLARLTNWRG